MSSKNDVRKVSAAVLAVAALLSTACGGPDSAVEESGPVEVATSQEVVSTTSTYLCSSSPVPAGYVVTKIANTSLCTPAFTYTITLPYTAVVMCSVPSYTYPAGWVVTEILSTTNCWAGTPNSPGYWGRRLYQPYSGIVVCASSPTPTGWYRTTRLSTSKCNGEWGYVLRPL